MQTRILKQLEDLLSDAALARSWGAIEIDLKDGKPILIRHTKQFKVDEDYPAHVRNAR
ncbi:hypothetical protein HDF16_001598 [Granulicella aggregans]|uniref:Uncharacterized protein n=1 Tax=Granulicella aggregans TaxID=474949 RepID=A0A7W8E2I3_9BACT|nr:hypothetical protein [Granulicella aggregans]MBB5056913.1 hypothetical protein [Granulicella aggregans]